MAVAQTLHIGRAAQQLGMVAGVSGPLTLRLRDRGFLLFLRDWWETASDMPTQLALLQGSSSAFQTGPIEP
jgi:hypothetical protein